MLFNLRVRTVYSILKGILEPDKVFQFAKENGQDCVGIIEENSLSSYIKAFELSNKTSLKFICGFERDCDELGTVVVILANNNFEGFLKVFNSDIKNHKITYKSLKHYGKDMLVLLHPEFHSDIKKHEKIKELQEACKGVFAIASDGQKHPFFDFLPPVAAPECLYLKNEDRFCTDVLQSIKTGQRIDMLNQESVYSKLLNTTELQKLFKDLPEALTNLLHLKAMVNSSFQKTKLIHIPIISGDIAKEGWQSLENKGLLPREEYKLRLEKELNIIVNAGFANYFLIVSDFVKWAKRNEIPIGPGRGSCVGSIVSWCLDITEIDPIEFNLIFERFLNEGRLDYPDIDIDVCQEKRKFLIQYLQDKYNKEQIRVAHISAFARMHIKSCIKDLIRATSNVFTYFEANLICSFLERGIVIEEILKILEEKIEDLENKENLEYIRKIFIVRHTEVEEQKNEIRKKLDELERIIYYALKLEGAIRNLSVHASGIIISDLDLTSLAPLVYENGVIAVNLEMEDLAKLGLIKFDILGLSTLTVLSKTMEKIGKNMGFLSKLDNCDYKALNVIYRGKTCGIFQFERGLISFKSSSLNLFSFNEVIDLISLNRPGVMKFMDTYITNKNSDEIGMFMSSKKEVADKVLKPTGGVFIYQEQIIEFLVRAVGYSLAEADILRRVISKGKELSEEQAEKFKLLCIKNKVSEEDAALLFDAIRSGYSFNKSHAVPYARLSYLTAYCKAHYFFEFMSVLLYIDKDNPKKVASYMSELALVSRRLVLFSNIVICKMDQEFLDETRLFLPPFIVKGVGEKTVLQLAAKQLYIKNAVDLVQHTDLEQASIIKLLECGCFGDLNFDKFLEQINILKNKKVKNNMLIKKLLICENFNNKNPFVSDFLMRINILVLAKAFTSFNTAKVVIEKFKFFSNCISMESGKTSRVYDVENQEFDVIAWNSNLKGFVNLTEIIIKNNFVFTARDKCGSILVVADTVACYNLVKKSIVSVKQGVEKDGFFVKLTIAKGFMDALDERENFMVTKLCVRTLLRAIYDAKYFSVSKN